MSKNLYHEIKNQLSVCDLYIEIIRKSLDKRGIQDEVLNRAIKAIKNSLTLINETTVSLRAQCENVKLTEENIKLLVDDVFLSAIAYCDNKKIEFINEISDKMFVKIDKNKMFSVLINLVKNAIEAIKLNGYVKIFSKDESLYIENNGEQIPELIVKNIFDDGFTTKEYGSGFGLMIAKKMLNAQGLDLKLEITNNKKTVFCIFNK